MAPRKQSQGIDPSPAHAGSLASYLDQRPARGAMADFVTDALREAILGGEITASSWLREEDLAAELRVSRTPVREAIRRLTAEGLVVRVPNQGAQVTPMTLEDILAVYAVRENLEGLAARLAAQRTTDGLRQRLLSVQTEFEAAAESGDVGAMAAANLAFHRTIREASENPYLERFLTLVEHSVRRFGASTFEAKDRIDATVNEHRAIITAITGGQPDEAQEHAREHMRRAREARLSAFLRAYS